METFPPWCHKESRPVPNRNPPVSIAGGFRLTRTGVDAGATITPVDAGSRVTPVDARRCQTPGYPRLRARPCPRRREEGDGEGYPLPPSSRATIIGADARHARAGYARARPPGTRNGEPFGAIPVATDRFPFRGRDDTRSRVLYK